MLTKRMKISDFDSLLKWDIECGSVVTIHGRRYEPHYRAAKKSRVTGAGLWRRAREGKLDAIIMGMGRGANLELLVACKP